MDQVIRAVEFLFAFTLLAGLMVLLAAVILTVLVISALLAHWVAPFDPSVMKLVRRLKPPSDVNWFGTDEFGRDILSRIIFGARASLGIGFLVVLFSMGIGTVFGLLAGDIKTLDSPIMRLADARMALPDILLAIFLMAVLGPSAGNVVLALSIVYAPRVVRVVRASTLVVSALPFVEAARALGVSTFRILRVHIY
jgi:peptide/nickel transport system permease protein